MARPKELLFKGGHDAQGRPLRWFAGVPARTLREADIAALDDATLANITGGDKPVYVDPDKKEEPPEDEAPPKDEALKSSKKK